MRCRQVPNAASLLRLAQAYAVWNSSLKDVVAWAGGIGVAEVTGPGLICLSREARGWSKRVSAQTQEPEMRGTRRAASAGSGRHGVQRASITWILAEAEVWNRMTCGISVDRSLFVLQGFLEADKEETQWR